MKNIIKLIAFIILFLLLLNVVTIIITPKWIKSTDPALSRIKGFYKEKKGTLDVIVIGNSDVGRGYSPITVWDEYGIASYNLGTSSQSMGLAYYLAKESLCYQTPNLMILDMNALYNEDDAPEGEYRKLFDNIRLGKTKIEAIFDRNLSISNKDKLSYIFPILRFHSRWSELEDKDFKKIKYSRYKKVSHKGMAVNADIKPYIDKAKYMEEKGEKAKIPEKNLNYFKKIVKLCEDNNVKLLLIEIPSTKTWSLSKNKKTAELANEYGLKFIDYNIEENKNKINLDWNTDFADGGYHLNINGAEKISKDLGNIMINEYKCKNHKNEQNYSSWYKDSEKYHLRVEKEKNK